MNIKQNLVQSSWIMLWITMHIKVFIKGDGKQVRTLSNFGFRRRNARNSASASFTCSGYALSLNLLLFSCTGSRGIAEVSRVFALGTSAFVDDVILLV